jgi:hypothetical protein
MPRNDSCKFSIHNIRLVGFLDNNSFVNIFNSEYKKKRLFVFANKSLLHHCIKINAKIY